MKDRALDSAAEENSRHADTRNRPETMSQNNPVYADDVIALRESPVAIRSRKSQAKPTLDSLKKTILKLRGSLMLNNKKSKTSTGDDRVIIDQHYDYRGVIVAIESVSGRSSRWDDSTDRLECSMSDSGKRNLDGNLDKEATWRTRRARNAGAEDNRGGSRIFYSAGLEKRDWKESQDRKRNRRSFVADSYYNNQQKSLSENEDHRRALITEGALVNLTKTPEGIIAKSRSNEGSLASALNVTSLFDPREFSSNEQSGILIRDRLINLMFIPSANGRTNVTGLRYPSSAESRPNGSLPRIDSDPRTRLLKSTAESGISATSSIVLGQSSSGTSSADCAAMDRANSANPDDKSLARDTIRFSQADDASGGSGGRSEDRNDVEKLGTVARKISRVGADDGQSWREGTALSPRGNSPRAFDSLANESRCCVLEGAGASTAGERNDSRKESREPVAVVIKVLELRGRAYEKQGADAVRLSQLMGKNRTVAGGTRMSGESSPAATDSRGPEAASAMTREDSARVIADDSQQQMVPAPLSGNGGANKSNGNSASGGIDIRGLRSNGNETMNVKETARPGVAQSREHGNNLRRKLLWISKASADADAESSTMESAARLTPNVTSERSAGAVGNDDPEGKKIGIKCDDSVAASPKSQDSDANRHARQKRSGYLSDDLAGLKNAAVAKEAADSRYEKRENDEEYLNQNAEGLKYYNDREDIDAMEGRTLIRCEVGASKLMQRVYRKQSGGGGRSKDRSYQGEGQYTD